MLYSFDETKYDHYRKSDRRRGHHYSYGHLIDKTSTLY